VNLGNVSHMSKVRLIAAAFGTLALVGPHLARSVEHYDKAISLLEVSPAGCYFFQLQGVTLADPAIPNNVWFGIPDLPAFFGPVFA
jgi:hypothetical protein